MSKTKTASKRTAIKRPVPVIEGCILMIRGQKVLLDEDLAALYGVTTGRLNEAVKRNKDRFPGDFMFRLTPIEGREITSLRSQIAILNPQRGKHRKYAPYVFTEHGVAMLSSVLHSQRAIQVNIAIVRTFVRLRKLLAEHDELATKLENLENRQNEQGEQIRAVFQTIEHLLQPSRSDSERRQIGFPTSRTNHATAG